MLYKLFQRLQIVYYRINMALDTSAMSTSILAKTSKRNYPIYTPCRSNAIWNSRDDLLRYEEALLVEREYEKSVEKLMVYNSSKTKKIVSAENGDAEVRDLMIKSWTLCEDRIGLWDECISEKEAEGDSVRPYYMRRFEAGKNEGGLQVNRLISKILDIGWIYTRLLDHGTEILGKLHEYNLEALILNKLIDQKFYRLGKRGKWYDRLALVQSKYLNKDQARIQKKLAFKTCIDAIHDPRVHQSKVLA
jgi:Fanconi-associated nuclease 1